VDKEKGATVKDRETIGKLPGDRLLCRGATRRPNYEPGE
jgi:hypothetical protein